MVERSSLDNGPEMGRSVQAFPLFTTGELLFFAYFTEAPMVVCDEATRTLLRERGYDVLSAAS